MRGAGGGGEGASGVFTGTEVPVRPPTEQTPDSENNEGKMTV